MGKNKKNKIRKKKNGNRNRQKRMMTRDPKVFFKKIGIKPAVKPGEESSIEHVEKEIEKRCSQNVINQVFAQNDACGELRPIDHFH